MNTKREPHPASVIERIEKERKLFSDLTCAHASAYIDFKENVTFCVRCVKRERFVTGFFQHKKRVQYHILYSGLIKFRECLQCHRQILQHRPAVECPDCIHKFYMHRKEMMELGLDGDTLPHFVLSSKPPPLILFITKMRRIIST